MKPLPQIICFIWAIVACCTSGQVFAENPECPPADGRDKDRDGDDDGTDDWVFDEQVDEKGNKITYYCLDKGGPASHLALKFERPDGTGGWIGGCFFEGGDNQWAKDDVDEDENGVHDEYTKVVYTNEDGHRDDDDDGKTDDYHWEYDVRSNTLTFQHTHDGEVVEEKTGEPPQSPAGLTRFPEDEDEDEEVEEGEEEGEGEGEESESEESAVPEDQRYGRTWMKFTPDQYASYMALRGKYWDQYRETREVAERVRFWQIVAVIAFLGALGLSILTVRRRKAE